MFSEKQAQEIKQQLIKQLGKNFIGKELESAKQQVESMTPEEIEQFLKKNGMAVNSGNEKCIFCSIIFGDISSYRISESENALAVLEINPISKGHVIVIPKTHSEELSGNISEFAENLSKTIKNKLSLKKTITSEQVLFGHKIVNIIPVYNNETLDSKRHHAKEEELENLQKILAEKPNVKNKEESKKKPITSKNLWLPKRFP